MRVNALRRKGIVDVEFDDLVVTPEGQTDFHPDVTTHISGPQWGWLYEGMAFALRLGMAMNVHVTVVYGRLGVSDDAAAHELLEDFCAVLRKRAGERKWPCAYAYAHERTRDEGLHTHLLTVWPYGDRASFEKWVLRYFARRSGHAVPDPTAVVVQHKRDGDVERHWLWFGYMTKGADPKQELRDVDDRHRLYPLGDLMLRRHESGGVVRCRKRVGLSRNLDWKARQNFGESGFRSAFLEGASTKEALYIDAYLRDHHEDRRREEMVRMLPPTGSFSLL